MIDDHDDDDILINQDYDLDNLYSREQVNIEEDEIDSISEEDNDDDDTIDKHDQVQLIDLFCIYIYAIYDLFYFSSLFCQYPKSKTNKLIKRMILKKFPII